MTKQIKLGLLVSSLLVSSLSANSDFASATITSTAFETTELQTTSSTEIYTSEDIKKSNSSNIYEFLNEQSSVITMPSSGNIFMQKLDLRGFGITNGYQNIAVIVDGRKLNNIDMTTQLLSAIPINTIEQIEIRKGSGSVEFGDNATAGVISITTNGKYKNKLSGFVGSDNTKSGTVLLGFNNDKIIANGMIDYYSTNGNRIISTDGKKDDKVNKNKKVDLKYFPTDDLELRASRKFTNIENKYANGITLEKYNEDPTQIGTISGGKYYSEQKINSYITSLGTTYNTSSKTKLDIDFTDENKVSNFILPWAYKNNYETKQLNTKYEIKLNSLKLLIGIDKIDAKRIGSTNTTIKDNQGIFLSVQYNLSENINVLAGARKEKINYSYVSSAQNLTDKENLNAYDIGFNYKPDDKQSFFINYNKAFQAPDIDRFFTYNFGTSKYEFNGFIEPAKSKTINIGYNRLSKNNKLKITAFRSNLENEIYYYSTGPWSGKNTNIDKSHKYGLELFNKYKINDNYFTSVNYSYIIAKIDEENEASGAYNGKNLPGVSKHNITLNLSAKYDKISGLISHTYRSDAYNSEDFANNDAQKQEVYQSTNLSLKYNYNENIKYFIKINNIFDKKNGMWVRDDHIFPVNFERTFTIGLNKKF